MSADLPDKVPLAVDALPTLAGHLSQVLEEFEAWGIKVHRLSRLPRILRIIEHSAEAGRYPADEEELWRVGAAIQVAQEFIEIGNVLPKKPVKLLKEDIEIALRGNLEWSPKDKRPLQRQTQLWVGAMMVQAGAPTGVLQRPTGKNPDFELANGSFRYAVEVKRPETAKNGEKLVSEAAAQISDGRYHGGSIVVDLTDCIDESITCTSGSGEPRMGELHERLVDLARGLHRCIFDGDVSRIRARRAHVFGLVAFTRQQYWNLDDLSVPYVGRAVITIEYHKGGSGTLKAHRARWLGSLVHKGIEASGHMHLGDLDVSVVGELD